MPLTEGAIAGLTAAASITNMAGSSAFNAAQSKKQRKWSEKMTNQQNEWNLNMWNKANEYNTPLNQVNRLREAGLNPLYYGLDGSSAGQVESAQALGYDRANIGNLENPVGSYLDAKTRIAQIENIQAQTAKTKNENLTETQRREKLIADIENTKQELNNLKSQEGLTDAQRVQIEKNVSWLDRLNEATIAEKESSAKLNDSQKKRIDDLLEGEKLLQAKSAEDFDHKWKKIRAEIAKMSKETDILEKDIENYALNHANNGFMGTGLSLPNLFRFGNYGTPKWTDEGNENDPLALAREGQ